MINIKSKKGITLVSLIVTVIILLILSGTAIYNYRSSNDVSYYNKMASDIKLLNDKILIYYNKYAKIPVTDKYMQIEVAEVGSMKYYEIDLSKLEGVTLNYGKDYGKEELTDTSDVYLINSNLHIYYMKGVKKDGELHYFSDENIKYASDIENEETGLPIGLVELEYIESTGTQYIDTGYKPNSNTSIELKVSGLELKNITLYCARTNQNLKTYTAFLINGNQLRVDYNSTKYSNIKTVTSEIPYVYKQDKNLIYVDNELIKTINDTNEFNSDYNMTLLASHEGGNNISNKGKAKLYYCKILDNGTLVRDFIPCQDSNGVVCLYDKVEDKYYYNQGTGDFVAGPEV